MSHRCGAACPVHVTSISRPCITSPRVLHITSLASPRAPADPGAVGGPPSRSMIEKMEKELAEKNALLARLTQAASPPPPQ